MNPWWMVPLWGVLGALVGAALARLTHASLAFPSEDHPLTTAVTVSSATAVLFGLLAWRVGVRPELLAGSALAAVCVPLAAIDFVENRMPARLLLPAYPSLAVLFDSLVCSGLRWLGRAGIPSSLVLSSACVTALGAWELRWSGEPDHCALGGTVEPGTVVGTAAG